MIREKIKYPDGTLMQSNLHDFCNGEFKCMKISSKKHFNGLYIYLRINGKFDSTDHNGNYMSFIGIWYIDGCNIVFQYFTGTGHERKFNVNVQPCIDFIQI